MKDKVIANNSTMGSYINLNPKDDSINSTKYDLDLCHKVKRRYKDFLPKCQTFQQWEANTKFKFGFIPLGEFKKAVSVSQSTLDSLQFFIKKLRSRVKITLCMPRSCWTLNLTLSWTLN